MSLDLLAEFADRGAAFPAQLVFARTRVRSVRLAMLRAAHRQRRLAQT
ncbi:hypothetical protein [Actinoplanes sp. NPDC049265]